MRRHRSNTFTKRGRLVSTINVLFAVIVICAIVIMLSIEGVVSLAIGGVACATFIVIAVGVLVMSTTNR